jgi:hypothetical protein
MARTVTKLARALNRSTISKFSLPTSVKQTVVIIVVAVVGTVAHVVGIVVILEKVLLLHNQHCCCRNSKTAVVVVWFWSCFVVKTTTKLYHYKCLCDRVNKAQFYFGIDVVALLTILLCLLMTF